MAKFGETLKRERELRKISLREVSEGTKIGLRYLEALEENKFDQLPGGLFNKGFIRAYAKFIGLDGETLVNSYLYDIAHLNKSDPARPRFTDMEPDESLLPAIAAQKTPRPRRIPFKMVGVGAAIVLVLGALGAGFVVPGRWTGMLHKTKGPRRHEAAAQQAGLLRSAPSSGEPALSPDSAVKPPAAAQAPAPTPEPPPGSSQGASEKEAEQKPSKHQAPVPRDIVLFLGTDRSNEIAVRCDGVEKVKRELAAAETIAVSCPGEVLLSAENAGALTLKINGRECLPLGENDSPLVDFHLNAERAREICPPEKAP